MTSKWFVLRIKSRSESLVAGELARNGYHCFLPRVKTLRPNQEFAYAPLFPGYLFLHIDIESADAEIARHRAGVLGWLRFDDSIPSISEEIVTDIRQRVLEINKTGGLWKRFRRGDRIRVVSGCLESLGEVTEEPDTSRGKVRVLLQLMGGMVAAHVPWHTLQSLSDEPESGRGPRRLRRTRGRGRRIQDRGAIGLARG